MITALLATTIFFTFSTAFPNLPVALVLAASAAAVSSYLLGKRLLYTAAAGKLVEVLLTSLMIVLLSHFVFGLVGALIAESSETLNQGLIWTILTYVYVGTFYGGVVTIPSGLIAGTFIYLILKRAHVEYFD